MQTRYQPEEAISGRYLIHEVLSGGMGEVYLCLDLKTGSPVALKTIQARYTNIARYRQLFEKEVNIWATLEYHPNIVRCFYFEIVDNLPFVVSEWVGAEKDFLRRTQGNPNRGDDLKSWIAHGPLDPEQAIVFAIDICRGLCHAAEKQPGIVHRDLKPGNVLIGPGAVAKINDFGLAMIMHEIDTSLGGTPAYMAPEQWRLDSLDARTDIYALGCILYEMLTGKRPFYKVLPIVKTKIS